MIDVPWALVVLVFLGFSLWMLLIAVFVDRDVIDNRWTMGFVAGGWCCFIAVLMATRSPGVAGDMPFYLATFRLIHRVDLVQAMTGFDLDPGFLVLMFLTSRLGDQNWIFQAIAVLALLAPIVVASRRLFRSSEAALLIFAITIFPLFAFYAGNTVRQGLAIGMLLLALALLVNPPRRRWIFWVLLSLAVLFHASAFVPAVVLIVQRLWPVSVRAAGTIWVVAAIAFLADYNRLLQSLLNQIAPAFARYADVGTIHQYLGGTNRLDFFGVSLLLVLGCLAFRGLDRSEAREVLLSTPILFNTYFLLLGFVAYSDRLAAYSWFFIPIVFAEWCFRRQDNRTLGPVVFVSVTLAMTFCIQGVPGVIERGPVVGVSNER